MEIAFNSFEISGTFADFMDFLKRIARDLLIRYPAFIKMFSAMQSGAGVLFSQVLPSALVVASSVKSQSHNIIKFGWTPLVFSICFFVSAYNTCRLSTARL